MLQSKINIGRLDRRILIQSPVTTKDEYNQDEITSWSDLATVWASVGDSVGTEIEQADQITATRTTTFNIRYRSDITEVMRIIFDERIYDIDSIQRPDRNRSLVIKGIVSDEPYVAEMGAFSNGFSNGFDI